MKQHSKKKKRPRPSNKRAVKTAGFDDESKDDKSVLKVLTEAFTSVSVDVDGNGDPKKAAEIRGNVVEISEIRPVSCLSSSSGSSSSNLGHHRDRGGCTRDAKQKKVVAATGTVSTVIGKEYVMSTPRKGSSNVLKGYAYEPANRANDAEQFLCSMLGEDCELSLAVIRDVLSQCGYDVEKALNALLELCASSFECSTNEQMAECIAENRKDTQFLNCTENLTDRVLDSTSQTSESESQYNEWNAGYHCRNYSDFVTGSRVNSTISIPSSKTELSEKVLEALFNMPQHSVHEPKTMKWRDIVKKMESLGQRSEFPVLTAPEQKIDHGDVYQVLRKDAKQNWDMMKSCYHKAAAAFSNGQRDHAAYLSEQGRVYNKMAQEADEKASKEIFRARNKSIENVIAIDLHGQHVKQAIRLLKVHLIFGAYACSVQTLRVITGCGGSRGVGKSTLKQSVIGLLKREGLEWKEENRGTILIRLDGQREFSFQESDDDGD